MPELSIIVPVYKVEKYLPKCIDSILAQTFRDFELILIDDGSPDNCGLICDTYAAQYPRIKVIHQDNQGVSAARNAALDIATGTYLGFVDGDDWIAPEMYETMIAASKQWQADIVACGSNHYDEHGTYLRSILTDEGLYDKEQMLTMLYGKPNPLGGGCCNKIIRAAAATKCRFRKEIAIAEDWLFLYDSIQHCSTCRKIPQAFYNVTERTDSATRGEEAEVAYQAIQTSGILLELARGYSLELEKKATDKFLDDCERYGIQIRRIGAKTGSPYRLKLRHIRRDMLKVLLRAYFHKLLSKSKIHGYIMGMIKL